MKTYYTSIILLLLAVSAFAQQKKDLYIIDFHNSKEYNSILGKNVANEFESSLQLCKGKYRIIPRIKYQRQLDQKTFEFTKRFLEKEGIDYVVYGDIFHDDNLKKFTIEYIFEEVSTGSIILIETISFDHISQLVNASNRKNSIEEKLKYDEELCKRFSEKTRPEVIDEDALAKTEGENLMEKDSDNDGVPDALDKEPNTAFGATVNERGEEVMEAHKGGNGVSSWKEKEKQAILSMLPDLPNIPFDDGKSDLNEDAYMKLDQMARLMKMYPIIVVNLEGIDTENEAIANERAAKIKEFLTKNYRLPEKRFVTQGKIDEEATSEVVTSIAFDKMDF